MLLSVLPHMWNTLQRCRQSSKLRTITTSINTNLLVKFGTSDIRCVEFRAKKLCNKHVDVNKCSSSQVWNTLQRRRQSSKLRIMTININTKVLVNFRTSEMRCVVLRAEKSCNKHIDVNKCSSSQVWNTLQRRHQSSKIMTASINTKVLVKFGTSEMRCVELRAETLCNIHIDVIKCSSSQVWNTLQRRHHPNSDL